MRFSDVLHQDAAMDRLQRVLRSGRVPHAYLFSGPAGVGKEMLAVRLASALLCARAGARDNERIEASEDGAPPRLDACEQCQSCVMVAAGTHPDLHRIYRALSQMHPEKRVRDQKAIDLSIHVIRHFVIEKMGLRPSQGRAKVFIVAEAERMNEEAQNAMLKVLEEPPDHSYLILLTVSADALLATIRSRTHQVVFRALPTEFVEEKLAREQGAPPSVARLLAEIAQGSLGDAIRYLQLGLHEAVPAVLDAMAGAANDPLACGKLLLDVSRQLAGLFQRQEADPEDAASTNAARAAHGAVLLLVSTVLRDVQRRALGLPLRALDDAMLVGGLAGARRLRDVGDACQAVKTAETQVHQSGNVNLIFDSLGIVIGRALGGDVPTRRARSSA